MPTKTEKKAISTFNEGYNCAQSILAAFGPKIDVGFEQCIKLGNPFGAGMGFRQETCGVVTGALMVLGFISGSGDLKDQETREKCYDNTRLLLEKFTALHGNILCRELLHFDISTPEGRKSAKEQDIFTHRCIPLISSAVRIIEEILTA